MEILVVIAISVVLSTIAIVYSNQGRNQVALSVDAAKVSQLILQAKQLAIATYNSNPGTPACGYGMYFNIPSSTYSLFIYSPPSARSGGFCPSLASATASTFDPANDVFEYSQQSWQVPVAEGLVLQDQTAGSGNPGSPSAVAVIFFPPNPQTLITNVDDDGAFSTTTAYVDIATADGSVVRNITITSAGQVSF